MENLEINPYVCGQLIFHKNAKTIRWGKIVFSIHGAGKIEYSHVKQ